MFQNLVSSIIIFSLLFLSSPKFNKALVGASLTSTWCLIRDISVPSASFFQMISWSRFGLRFTECSFLYFLGIPIDVCVLLDGNISPLDSQVSQDPALWVLCCNSNGEFWMFDANCGPLMGKKWCYWELLNPKYFQLLHCGLPLAARWVAAVGMQKSSALVYFCQLTHQTTLGHRWMLTYVGDVIPNLEFVVGILLPPAVRWRIGCFPAESCDSDWFLKSYHFYFPNFYWSSDFKLFAFPPLRRH